MSSWSMSIEAKPIFIPFRSILTLARAAWAELTQSNEVVFLGIFFHAVPGDIVELIIWYNFLKEPIH